MKKSNFTLISVLGFGILFGVQAFAQQQVPVATIDGHLVVTGVREVTKQSLMDTVEQDMLAQGGNAKDPLSKKYRLRFGGTVDRGYLYINAEKGRYRWEPRSDLMKFTPADLPEQVFALMMKEGRLRALTPPTHEEYAQALSNELVKNGINPKTPGGKKACLKLGYQNCKLMLDFSEAGLLQWHYMGVPFMKGNLAEAMLRVLQAQGNLKAADGQTDLLIYQGDDLDRDVNLDESKPASGGSTESKSTKASAATEVKPAQAVTSEKSKVNPEAAVSTKKKSESENTSKLDVAAKSEVAQIKLAYRLSDDHSDYSESDSEDSGIKVKGVAHKSSTSGQANGNPFGHGTGTGENAGTGNGDGNGLGSGNGTGIGVGGLGDGYGIKTSLTQGITACNSIVESGGYGTTTIPMNFGPKSGNVHLDFYTYDIPDQILIRCNNHTMVNTGMVSRMVELDFDYKSFGVGAKANTCQIVVNGNENTNTKWKFQATCPGTVQKGSRP